MTKISPATFLAEPFARAWQNKDLFTEVRKLSTSVDHKDIFREKEGRRTFRFTCAENRHSYFLKYHQGIGWKEIFKNLFQLRAPVLGASNEYHAAIKLKSLGVDTLTPVAYGCRGWNPAAQESFLITEELTDTISLEDYCRHWKTAVPAFHHKQALIKKVAQSAKTMHEHGINHRDFYICHFLFETKSLLDKNSLLDTKNLSGFHCYLIDLHRCQMRSEVPHRWLIKDLGGLLYSTADIGLTQRDYLRFLKSYSGQSLRMILCDPIWREVCVNAHKLYKKDFGKMPPLVFDRMLAKAARRA